MNKKAILKSLEPVDPDKASVTVKLEASNGDKRATITVDSDIPMVGLDLVWALADFTNELAEALYNAARGNVPPSIINENEQ